MDEKLKEAINDLIDEQINNGELEEDVVQDIVDYLECYYEWRGK